MLIKTSFMCHCSAIDVDYNTIVILKSLAEIPVSKFTVELYSLKIALFEEIRYTKLYEQHSMEKHTKKYKEEYSRYV